MNCSVCGITLTGGLDTFGEVGAEMCLEHFFAPPEPTEDDLRILELNDELDALDEEIDQLESELADLKSEQWEKERELETLKPMQKPMKDAPSSLS